MQTFHKAKIRNIGLALALIIFVSNPAVTQPPYCNPCLFYGGDLNPVSINADALANENDIFVPGPTNGLPYGAAVYVAFTVPAGQSWEITGLFGNVITENDVLDPMEAFWTINSGVSTGNGGTVIASGTSAATFDPTGRFLVGDAEYTLSVTGLSVPVLAAGEYWFAVVPQCTNPQNPDCTNFKRFLLTNTEGANAFGPLEPLDQSFFDSAHFGFNFEPAINVSAKLSAFSAGIVGGSLEVSKSFNPNYINSGSQSTLKITLSFTGGGTLSKDFTDTLPAGLFFTGPNIASTDCPPGLVTNDLNSVTLPSGSTIPAAGSCTITATVTGSTPGTYANTIPADALVVDEVSSSPITAFLLVARLCL